MQTYLPALLVLLVAVATNGDHYHNFVFPPISDNTLIWSAPEVEQIKAEDSPTYWYNEAKAAILSRSQQKRNTNIAKNVILFLGDGMSLTTITAARTHNGQKNKHLGEEEKLFFESFPTVGLSKTYCVDAQIPDSACTATAYLTGVKTNFGNIGVTGAVPRFNCTASTDKSTHLDSIAVWALADGRDAGIVTSARVTHASPSATYARSANREWESDTEVRSNGCDPEICPDIAYQLIHTKPGSQFKVILGGGRSPFLPNTTTDEEGEPGSRGDGRNLIKEWEDDKKSKNASYRYVWNRSDLMELKSSPPEYLLGLFEGSHMQYHLEADTEKEPTLAELTEVAINSLRRNEKGFFLFVEGGRIDHAHHENFAALSLDETIEMDKAVKRAIELLGDEDTLVVVTADHAHVMGFSGYTRRGRDILGTSESRDNNDVPYQTLSYINGPGVRTPVNNIRVDVTKETNYGKPQWRSHTEVPLPFETHGGEDVVVLANGPYNHMFAGVYEQTQIPHLMAYAACIGPGLHACPDTSVTEKSKD